MTGIRGIVSGLLWIVLVSNPLAGQEGTIRGRVLDAETGEGVATAEVRVVGADAGTPAALTTASGGFSLQAAAGTYSLVVSRFGYQTERLDGVSVEAGQVTDVTIDVQSQALVLNPIVVSGSRREEKALDAPASIVTLDREEVQERVSLSPMSSLRGLAGVDVAENGLNQGSVVTRGFNNIFSGALLVLTDNRYASVPSLRFNAYNLIPTSQTDIERIEVLLGPAAALYGPNSANGVLHMITTSPIDDPGTRLSITGGDRSVFQGQFRTGMLVGDRAGVKISGTFMSGEDWKYEDPFEVKERADAIAAGADPETLMIGARDYHSERWSTEARFDYRPWDDGEIIVSAGASSIVRSLELTGVGAGMTRDWVYSTAQVRLTKGRLFAQAFVNKSDAGDSFLLRTGVPLVDKSRAYVGQVQHGIDVGSRSELIYGIDLSRTDPRTEGTINGRYEDEDIISEVGGYLHSQTALSDQFDLVAAVRVDKHSELEDAVVSPRAALVYNPAEGQSFRATYNRAFSTPSSNNLFLDLVAASNPFSVGSNIRAVGVPSTGYTFNETCLGGVQDLCMLSPFSPAARLPALALGGFWNPLLQGLGASSPTLAPLVPLLLDPGSQPGDPTLETSLLRFNQELAEGGGFPFVGDPGASAIKPIAPTISTTFELGYKGLLGDRLLVAADVYSSRIRDFVGPLRAETPTVHYSLASLQAFVLARLGGLLQAGVVTPADVELLVGSLGAVPLGTVAPDQVSPGDEGATDILITYRNFGDVELYGADFAFEFLANSQWTLNGSYSFVDKDCVDFDDDGGCSSALDIALNAPANKGSVGARWNDELKGLTVETRARFIQGFPMNSGVYVGDIDGYAIVDANIGYQLNALQGATITLTATNLFDNQHREFVGAPDLGRLLLVRLGWEF